MNSNNYSRNVILPGLAVPAMALVLAVASTASAQFPPYDPLGTAPVGNNTLVLWDLNQGSGTTATDSANPILDGNNSGTLTGPGVSWGAGKFGGGLNFGGGTGPSQPANVGYVSTPIDGSLFTATKQITMAAWIKPTMMNPTFGFNYIMGYNTTPGGSGSFGFMRFNGNATSIGMGVRVKNGSDLQFAEVSYNTPFSFIDGTWRHVTGTFDDGVMKMYIDGVEQASNDTGYSSANGWNILPPNLFHIGGVHDEPFDTRLNYHGFMDDVRLMNAVPEPSTFALAALGGLAAMCWRRRV